MCFLIQKQVISIALFLFPGGNPWPLPLHKLRSMARGEIPRNNTGEKHGGWEENAAQSTVVSAEVSGCL